MSARNNIYFKSSILDTMVQSRPKDLRYCTSATNFSNFVAAGIVRDRPLLTAARTYLSFSRIKMKKNMTIVHFKLADIKLGSYEGYLPWLRLGKNLS